MSASGKSKAMSGVVLLLTVCVLLMAAVAGDETLPSGAEEEYPTDGRNRRNNCRRCINVPPVLRPLCFRNCWKVRGTKYFLGK